MKAADNLRGWDVLVEFDGTPRLVTVVTHIRADMWLVEGRWSGRIRRATVLRDEMTLVALPEEAKTGDETVKTAAPKDLRVVCKGCGQRVSVLARHWCPGRPRIR